MADNPFKRRKGRRFVNEKELVLDYKDPNSLRPFLSERGKIVPRRISGLSAKRQRELSTAINRSRTLGLLPYVVDGA